jgi:hypothetical protein
MLGVLSTGKNAVLFSHHIIKIVIYYLTTLAQNK